MKLLILALTFFSINLFSKDYFINFHAKNIINEKHAYSKGNYYNILKLDGSFTDSLGNYGELITLGTSKSDKEKVILDFLLQGINQKGDKFIGRQFRNSLEQEVGVGSFFYISGTGDYKKLIVKKCYYAVKYLNANVFYKHKCH